MVSAEDVMSATDELGVFVMRSLQGDDAADALATSLAESRPGRLAEQQAEEDRRAAQPWKTWHAEEAQAVAAVERLADEIRALARSGDGRESVHRHDGVRVGEDGVLYFSDGCKCPQRSGAKAAPREPLRAVEMAPGTQGAPDGPEAPKRRRKRRRASLTVIRPYDY